MLRPRIIPVLLLKKTGFVKTIKFKKPVYLGDPLNILKIFNEKEVDELVILDIESTVKNNMINFNFLRNIVSECFMPVGYGGGINNINSANKIFEIGVEKIIINTYANEHMEFIGQCASIFGSQSVVVSVDVRQNYIGKYKIFTRNGRKKIKSDLIRHVMKLEQLGAGEILINSIDNDGTMKGYDIELIKMISESVQIPIIACGGAGGENDLIKSIKEGNASAAAAGSMFVFQGEKKGILISYPDIDKISKVLEIKNKK